MKREAIAAITCQVIVRRGRGVTEPRPCGHPAKWFVAYVGAGPVEGPLVHARCTRHLNTLKNSPAATEFMYGPLVRRTGGLT